MKFLGRFAKKSEQQNDFAPDDSVSESGRTTVVDQSIYPLRTYPQAWLALFLLVVLRSAISISQFSFSVVPTMTGELFGISLSAVNWIANIQGVMYVIMSFFTGWIFQHFGVKRSLILAGFLNALGCSIKSVAVILHPASYWLTMVGQVIGSSSAPLALNIMTTFAASWFTENMRATAGMFVASNYGAIIGMFVIPNLATAVDKIPRVVHIVSGIACAAFIPLLFMPAKPPTPPSRAIHSEATPSFLQGVRMLSKNYNFWILFLVHGINVGLSIGLGSIFTQIISPYGYTDAQAGQMNAIAFFAGTLGCSVSGPVLDSTKQHKLFLRLIAPMVFVTDIGFIFMVKEDSYAAILFVLCMNQFFLSFLVPVVIELASETSYPVADATTNSIIWQGCQVFGFIIVLAMDQLRDPNGQPKNNMYKALILQACLGGVMVVLSFCFNGRMARSEAIAQMKLAEQEESNINEKSVSRPQSQQLQQAHNGHLSCNHGLDEENNISECVCSRNGV